MLDELTRALSALAPQGEFSVIPLHNPRRGVDARIFRRGGAGWQSTGAAQLTAARAALAELPEVAAVDTRGDSLTVRFADARIARLGELLEAGRADALDARELLADTAVVVNFCDANPTKALHIGHLRNIALGQALAGALAAAGARVTRQSQVSDYCRSMGEALAGYLELPEYITPRTLGVKSDHFVGECFARYAAKLAERPDVGGTEEPALSAEAAGEPALGAVERAPSVEAAEGSARNVEAAVEPALSAEAAVRDDLAEELLAGWSVGDPEIVERWGRLRGWALEGQDATLAALGVKLDRLVNESDSRPLTSVVLDTGLARGVFTRLESGAVVYETGDPEYPRLLLARPDGFPTQHLRTIALWHSLRESLGETRTVELVGEEWHAYVRYHERLVRELELPPASTPDGESAQRDRPTPAPPRWHPTSNVLYGMVTVEGGAVKSSNGRPPLVDGVLERLCASRELAQLAAQSEGRLQPRTLAALIALGFYLGRPTRKPVDLTLSEMLDLRGGIGWELARAAVHAWSPRHDGPPDPAPEDGRYRLTVLQSQVHRQLLARAVERLDVYELARFYGHLSRRYLAVDADARVARAMRTLLAAGLGALGLPGGAPEGGAPR
ncbi:MAG: arginine--tRNA ligase [Solirubrobacterales bacterium]